MKAYLFVDVGSTYTKLTLLDPEREEILATTRAFTTVEDDVMKGFDLAFEDLQRKVGQPFDLSRSALCSSAAGGLKMIAIGLVPSMTSEAARLAALGAGAKVSAVYSQELNHKEVEGIIAALPDILLLAGGIDGGNQEVILHNGRMLVEAGLPCPIVVAGNKSARDKLEEVFAGRAHCRFCENVMPRINEVNVEPCRKAIREIFMERIAQAKGLGALEEKLETHAIPTPASVLMAAELLSLGHEEEAGLGDLAVIDIGGATTDVHSIAEGWPSDPSVGYHGLQEPLAKRSVEGDLGMRYSALNLYQDNENMLREYLGTELESLEDSITRRRQEPGYLADSEAEIRVDLALAQSCSRLAMSRHAGFVKEVYSPIGPVFQQSGKDLLPLPAVIGTGGVVVNSPAPREILAACRYNSAEPYSLKPKNPDFYLDEHYLLSAMGLLADIDPGLALRVMKKSLRRLE